MIKPTKQSNLLKKNPKNLSKIKGFRGLVGTLRI